MKKYILLLLAFLLVPALRAQGRFKVPNVSGVAEAVSRQAVRSELNHIGRVVLPGVTPAPGVSVAGYFHLVGSGKIADPVIHFPAPADKTTPRYTSQKRSRESLELELNANGILPRDFETYTNVQLEELLKSYRAMEAQVKLQDNLKTTTPVSDRATSWSRKDELLFERGNALWEWAESQPDFYIDNYWPDDYQEPFHPDVKSLTVLLISDDMDIRNLFSSYSRDREDITVINGGSSGEFGTKLITQFRSKIDIIVTDFVLEDKYGGYGVARYTWNNEINIPVVLLSKDPIGAASLLLGNIVGQVPYPVFPRQYDAVFNYLSNIVATGRAYPPRPVVSAPAKQERYISPFARFLSDEPENFAWSTYQGAEEWVAHAALKKMSHKRSLESVEAECLANGMLQEVIDKIPPTERLTKLEEWLSVYNSMRQGWRGPSRYEDVICEGKLSASDVQGISWITQQAEFQAVASNYLTATYPEPFHPQVSSLRILVVNDLTSVAEPLQEAAKDISKNGRTVTVDIAPTIDAAQNTLEKAFIARRPYDLVLLDYHGLEGRAADLSMWIYNNSNLSVPVVFYASTGAIPEILFKFNIVGRIAIAPTADEARQVLNYASNIVATGKAYPNNK